MIVAKPYQIFRQLNYMRGERNLIFIIGSGDGCLDANKMLISASSFSFIFCASDSTFLA